MNMQQANIKGRTPEERELLRRQGISETMSKHRAAPEIKEKHSAIMKRLWQDPGFRAKRSRAAKALWTDRNFRQRQKDAQHVHADPEWRKGISESMKAYCSKPEVRERRAITLAQIQLNPESNRRRSETLKRFWATDEGKQKKRRQAKQPGLTPER
jgi:hypothetical protein